MTITETDRTEVYVDPGPVLAAANVLIERSTLAEHLRVELFEDPYRPARVYQDPDGVPFALWGSGTQALWSLLCAIAYSGERVSLYEVAARCDVRNRRAVLAAVTELLA